MEIKFRAWDKKFNKMRYNPLIPLTSFINDTFKNERFVIMQYTGLHDIEDKEIYVDDLLYEGQVIFCDICHGFQVGHPDNKGMICYSCDGDFHINDIDVLKVIGNIWENPELWEHI